MTRSPVEGFVDKFAAAATAACRLELRIRMFADMHDDLRPLALDRLEDVEDAIIARHVTDLSASEQAALKGARRVRNKVLHCEFWAAEDRLKEHGVPLGARTVHAGDFVTGAVRRVNELGKSEPRIFGWLLEGANGGLFAEAEHLFHEATLVILRLANLEASRAMAAPTQDDPRRRDDMLAVLERIVGGMNKR